MLQKLTKKTMVNKSTAAIKTEKRNSQPVFLGHLHTSIVAVCQSYGLPYSWIARREQEQKAPGVSRESPELSCRAGRVMQVERQMDDRRGKGDTMFSSYTLSSLRVPCSIIPVRPVKQKK